MEVIQYYCDQLGTVSQELELIVKDLRKLEADESRDCRALKKLEHEHNIPSLKDLSQSRNQRDADWQMIKQYLLGENMAPMGSHNDKIIDTYEGKVHHADSLADELRAKMQQVSEQKRLTDQITETQQLIKERKQVWLELNQKKIDLEQEHTKLWHDHKVASGYPQEMKAWLPAIHSLIQRIHELCGCVGEACDVEKSYQKIRALKE